MTSSGDWMCDEQTRADNAQAAYDALYAEVEPDVLSERKAAIREQLRRGVPPWTALNGQQGEEWFGLRIEVLIGRVVNGEPFGDLGSAVFTLVEDAIDIAAREGLAEAVAKECAERER